MKINYQLKRFAVLTLLSTAAFYSCKKNVNNNEAPNQKTSGTIARAANEVVNAWVTTADQSKLLQAQASFNFGADAGTNATTITVDENQTYQGIDGFGFTLTGGSAGLLNGLGANQTNVLNELFGTANGQIGISYIRISIGASDLSSSDFTYNQTAGDFNMNNFSISAENQDLLPILKKIIAINPSIKIIATPWTAPTWMKVNTTGNNGYTGGSLNTAAGYYDAYARYFVKYLPGHAGTGDYH